MGERKKVMNSGIQQRRRNRCEERWKGKNSPSSLLPKS